MDIKKIDTMGRVMIPSDIRKELEMYPKEQVVVRKEGKKVIIEKLDDVIPNNKK